jgi:predicted deacylase
VRLELERILGRIRGEEPGPTLVCVGGLHGNEPAGVLALERVLTRLSTNGLRIRGEFIALAGNRTALAEGRRFMAIDLNRAWEVDRVRAVLSTPSVNGPCPEDHELLELLDAVEDVAVSARGTVYVLDLHTTSGPGGVFTTVADTLASRAFAMSIPVPLVLGLEELVEGTMLEYLGGRGFVAAVFEGGQHEDPLSVDRTEAAIWIALAESGLITERESPEVAEGRKMLRREVRGLPRALEMKQRHHFQPADGFQMRPGFRNFDPVQEGDVIAYDRGGEVRALQRALILMPLYQELGNDGFFLVRPFSASWLHLSRWLRKIGADGIVHWLPGVRKDPERPGVLVANRNVARWYALEIFHLLGYRKHLEEGRRLVVTRRGEEMLDGPECVEPLEIR